MRCLFLKTLNSPTAWLFYRKAWNRAVSAIRSAKTKFFSNLSSLVKNPKNFGLPTTPYFPIDNASQWCSQMAVTVESTTLKCELLNCHFTRVFSNSNLEPTYNPPEPNPHLPSFQTSPVLRMKFFTFCPSFPGKHHLALMVSLVPCFRIQPQSLPPPSPSCLTDLCHFGRSLLTGNSQISHLYQKVVTPNLFQIIAPYRCCHCYQKFLNILSTTGFYLIYSQTAFSQTLSLASVPVAPPRRHSLLQQPAGINIWMRSRVLQLSSLISQKLLIRFPTWVSSELLLKLVSPAHCTPGLLTIYLVAQSMLSLMVTPHRSPKFPLVSRKVQF